VSRFLFAAIIYYLAMISAIPAQSTAKREFRAAWVASVANLDFPTSRGASTNTQRTQLINLIRKLKSVGMNAVIFQIRPECDALYHSDLEPWSYWLTGVQGKAPNPDWDPLETAIEETHKLGMELHAWFNPYRAVKTISGYSAAANHVSVLHPEWTLTCNTLKILDPGLPEVRNWVTHVIVDVLTRYEIDGIHFDDYFYPYPEYSFSTQDSASWRVHNRGFTNKSNWRRDNVNMFIAQIYDTIQVIKPYVRLGVSPFGIWKSGTPSGIVGLSAYSDIYCDARAWLDAKTVDYIMPQLYWAINKNGQQYSLLMPWWASVKNGRHFYPGKIFNSSYSPAELPNQIKLDRENGSVDGSCLFRASFIYSNSQGINDSLRNNYYKYPALVPVMSWKDSIPPNPPQNLALDPYAVNGIQVRWNQPVAADDGETASRYALYLFTREPNLPADLDSVQYIYALTGKTDTLITNIAHSSEPYYLVATALDHNHNESEPSNVLGVIYSDISSSPQAPISKSILMQNYPNPFNATTRFSFELAQAGHTVLKIYDLTGREVETILDSWLESGSHHVEYQAYQLPTGIYLYMLCTPEGKVLTKKMTLVK